MALKSLIFVLIHLCLFSKYSKADKCTNERYGDNCQYKCHCKGGCANNECRGACLDGWFGFQCQYEDLTRYISKFRSPRGKLALLGDGDDKTCLYGQDTLSVDLNTLYTITWIRLIVSHPKHIDLLKIDFQSEIKNSLNTLKTNIVLRGYAIDIQLDIQSALKNRVKYIIFHGMEYLQPCSLYISGGRNVAQGQSTNQTSTFGREVLSKASNAVDGNTDTNYINGGCTHTDEGDISPTWRLTLQQPYLITRLVLFNRVQVKSLIGRRLRYFRLQMFDEKQKVLFDYTDPSNETKQTYTVIPNAVGLTKYISISARDKSEGLYLTLCEVEAYAECPFGTWGLHCDKLCEVCSGKCRVDDGACNQMCFGDPLNCTKGCKTGEWGSNCDSSCSSNCLYKSCNSQEGLCTYGCIEGYMPDTCSAACSGGYYGESCKHKCSTNCINETCAAETGVCKIGCKPGYVDVYCNIPCSYGKYGETCKHNCTNNCKNPPCLVESGNCRGGCKAGFEGEDCRQVCKSDKFGEDCQYFCHNCEYPGCDSQTGYCDGRCKVGFKGRLCNTPCANGEYGENCKQNCSDNCQRGRKECNATDGSCIYGCKNGYKPPTCQTLCDDGYYGSKCSILCPTNCKLGKCDAENGLCKDGCKAGYEGAKCDKECDSVKWGENCIHSCSSNCFYYINTSFLTFCDKATGECVYGCKHGYTPPLCTIECTAGSYGINCSDFCSDTCLNKTCNATLGECLKCKEGYTGLYCEQVTQEAKAAYIIAITAIIIACLLVILIIILWRKKKNTSDSSQKKCHNVKAISVFKRNKRNYVEDDNEIELSFAHNETFEAEDQGTVATSQSTSINVKDLLSYIMTCNKELFIQQFKSVKDPADVTQEAALMESNRTKNRYKNICPYDHSRVLLNIDAENNEFDYINASYIKSFKGETKFIASQGPNKVMLDDFIRLLWEQKTNKLVMLTSVIEMGKLKCEQYWPDKGATKFGKIRVKLISEEKFAEYSIRRLELSKKDEPNHTVTQFHFEAWPDQNVPSSPWGLVDFFHLVSSSLSEKPIVVHCSAGVGRTGTFIGLFNLVEQASEIGRVDFYKTLSDLRQDRMWMIQTPNQYEFLHKAVLVATVCTGTFMEINDVSPRIYQLNQKTNSGKTKLEEEFETISKICTYLNDQMQPVSDEETDGVVYENTKNASKNRFNYIIPKDICRPVLTCEPSASGDYINAVIFESFKHKGHHILTQLPLAFTLVDFWRLVTEFNVSLIVAFETHLAAIDKTIAEYLPSNEEQVLMCRPFKIHSAYMKQTDEWEERKLTITMKSTSHKVVHLKSKFTDLNSMPFLSFIRQSRSYELPSEKILYVCRNGAKYSGLASVLTNLLDRLDNYLTCSVPLVVGTVKCIRPQAIPSLDQYNTVYDILNRYTETSCVYGNVDVNLLKKMDKK